MTTGRVGIMMMALIDMLALALAGVFITFIIFFANDFLGDSRSATSVWQPWLTAIGVIAAAFFVVWQQHKIAEREAEDRRRKSIAARAVMPAALAEICEYAQQCAHRIARLYPPMGENSLLAGPFPVPQFPSEAIKVLRDCIQHADQAHVEPIVACIQILQIQNSRILPLLLRSCDKPLPTHTFDIALLDVIDLHACCWSLYGYARFDDKSGNQTKEQYLISSASVCNLDKERFPSLFEYMKELRLIH